MIVAKINNYQNFNAFEGKKSSKTKQTVLEACGSALLLPFIPVIDGDGFKKTFENRNKAKFFGAMAGIGGLYVASKCIAEKICPNKTTSGMFVGATVLPALLFADNWSQKTKKPMPKKWYGIAAAVGATVMGIMNVNKSNKKS